MTDGLDQALADAGLNLLRADVGLTVYDGVVPPDVLKTRPAPPYVLVHVYVAQPSETASGANALDGRSVHRTVGWHCRCVGADAVTARAVAQRVRTQLLDQRPVVVGIPPESVSQIAEVQSDPAGTDETLGFPVMSVLRVYELYASA